MYQHCAIKNKNNCKKDPMSDEKTLFSQNMFHQSVDFDLIQIRSSNEATKEC